MKLFRDYEGLGRSGGNQDKGSGKLSAEQVLEIYVSPNYPLPRKSILAAMEEYAAQQPAPASEIEDNPNWLRDIFLAADEYCGKKMTKEKREYLAERFKAVYGQGPGEIEKHLRAFVHFLAGKESGDTINTVISSYLASLSSPTKK